MSRSAVLMVAVGIFGCGNKTKTVDPGNPHVVDTTGRGTELFRDLQPQFDLLANAHLADVDHHGLFIDFGTPARNKYTNGNWKSGWGPDRTIAGTTQTMVYGRTARVYFHVDPAPQQTALSVKLRVRPIGTRAMTLYMNNEVCPSVRLQEGDEFREYEVTVPETKVRGGENSMLLSFGGTVKVGNDDVSVAIDSIRISPVGAADAGSFSPPNYNALVSEVRVGSNARRAIAIRAPSSLRWYVEVPPSGKLGVGIAADGDVTGGNVRISVTPEGGAAEVIHQGPTAARWEDHLFDLTRFAGKIARIELRTEGQGVGRVAFSAPMIFVPKAPALPRKTARNVVVVLIDTMRADKFKAYDAATRVRTPAFDQFVSEGAVFLAAQSPENWTKPSVASVLTGLWPLTHRAKTDAAKLSAAATMLSESLKEAGFSTGSFIANGYVSDRFGFDQGWDHYVNFIRDNKPTQAQHVFQAAGDWIESHKGERFFAYVHTIDPHVPYDPPSEFLQMYDAQAYGGQVTPRATPDLLEKAKRNPPAVTFDEADKRRLAALYDAEVSYHDSELGKFIQRLKQLDVYDNTVFLITADHGEELNDHGSWGHGHSVFQELLGVPFVVRLPGLVNAGERITHTVSTVDVTPTILQAAGVAAPPATEGRSVLGFTGGRMMEGPAVAFSDFLDDRHAIRGAGWKLILRGVNPTLFNLAVDPHEQTELTPQSHPIVMRYMRTLMGQFLGASDRRKWLAAEQGSARELQTEEVPIDPTLRGQLQALGYAGGGAGEARPANP